MSNLMSTIFELAFILLQQIFSPISIDYKPEMKLLGCTWVGQMNYHSNDASVTSTVTHWHINPNVDSFGIFKLPSGYYYHQLLLSARS